jgi:hypothetical protein
MNSVAVSAVLAVLVSMSQAHVKLFYFPNAFPIRNARSPTADGTFSTNTSDGCGGQPMFGKNGVSYFRPGQTINMTFNYGTTVKGDHAAAANKFRIVFASLDGATTPAEDFAALKAGTVLQSDILAPAGSRPDPYFAVVQVPASANCRRCVLQAIEQRNWGACYDFTTIAPAATTTARPATTTARPTVATTRPVTTAATTARPTTTVRASPLPPGVTTRATTTVAVPARTTTAAPTAAPAVCGNGVVEDGEDCEMADGACCRADCKFAPSGIVCRRKDVALACDVDDVCTGSSAACTDAVAAVGTLCRKADAADVCIEDTKCDGELASCPSKPPIAVGRPCDDGEMCTQGDACSRLGECVGVYTCTCTTDEQCNTDRDSCTADLCNKDGVCNRDDSMDAMEGAACSDGDECTMGDMCNADGVCVGTALCKKTGENACMAKEKHGKCCGEKCLCNAGWTGDNCELAAAACIDGNNGCECNAGDTCTGALKCVAIGADKKRCAEPSAITPGDDEPASASVATLSSLVAVIATFLYA